MQWILEAVFARLGVRHEARNFGMGGLGTVQNGLGAASIYGPDVDILMWDSGMTEREDSSQDLLHRQYILGGGKVPVLWSLALRTIQRLHLDAGADVGFPGEGLDGIPVASTLEQYQDMPWAAQSISCDGTLKDLCRQEEYNGTCWIHRDDYTPQTPQNGAPGGRASWHPGNRKHQIRGRVLAYTILSALKDAVTLWRDAEGYVLPDEAWHLTDHYERVRAKVTESVGPCHEALKEQRLEFACKYPVKVSKKRNSHGIIQRKSNTKSSHHGNVDSHGLSLHLEPFHLGPIFVPYFRWNNVRNWVPRLRMLINHQMSSTLISIPPKVKLTF